MKTTIFTFILSSLFFNNILGQAVGINTDDPQATLDVNSKGNDKTTNALLVKNSDNKVLLNVKDNGYTSIGENTPTATLDLRNSDNSAIGIGWTEMTASEAGEGAVRYNPYSQNMEYSDGTRWVIMQTIRPKVLILAQNWYNPIDIPDSTPTQLGGWTATTDRLGNFDAATGVFTAPRDGIYSATVTINLKAGRVTREGSVLEAIWRTSKGQQTISSTPYVTTTGGIQNAIVLSATFTMEQGEALYPMLYHTLGVTRSLRVNETGSDTSSVGFNNLYIVEY